MENILSLLEIPNILAGIIIFMIMLRLFEKIRQKKLKYNNFEFGIYKGYYRFYMDKGLLESSSNELAIIETNKFIKQWKN